MQLEGALLRKAAGILLIILGIFAAVLMIVDLTGLSDFGPPTSLLLPMIWEFVFEKIVWCGLLVTGGILCLKRRYWGLCLVSALLPLLMNIHAVVAMYLSGHLYMPWRIWIPLLGQLIATVFICLRKTEWSESQAGLDFSASG